MRPLAILVLVLIATQIENCSSGVRKTSERTDKTLLLDTTFFLGEHKLYVGFLGYDTSFFDTIFLVRPTNDSIIFFTNIVHCEPFNNEFLLRREDYHFKTVLNNEYKIDQSVDSLTWVVNFNLSIISKNGNLYCDSIFYSYLMNVNSDEAVYYDRFLGYNIKK